MFQQQQFLFSLQADRRWISIYDNVNRPVGCLYYRRDIILLVYTASAVF
jgi:hypothetical protein